MENKGMSASTVLAMKAKLIELIREAQGCYRIEEMYADIDAVIDMPQEEEYIADHLIANGVIAPPCKIGDTIYMVVTVRRRPNLPKVSFVKTTRLTESNFFEVIRRCGKTVFLTKGEAVAHLPEPPKEE